MASSSASAISDALPQPGGQLITLYPEKMIFDTPGFPEVQAKKLVTNLYDQAKAWNPIWATGSVKSPSSRSNGKTR